MTLSSDNLNPKGELDNTCFGLYTNSPNEEDPNADLSLDFVVPLELISHWKKCSLVADFFANYQSYNFENQQKAMSVLSTIINELLENAIKFTADQNKLVSISLRRYDDNISIETVNLATKANATTLQKFIQTLETNNIEDLFFQQLEKAALSDEDSSGVGLISIIKDYGADVGIKIEPKTDENLFDVYVKVSISAKTLEEL